METTEMKVTSTLTSPNLVRFYKPGFFRLVFRRLFMKFTIL